MHHDGNFCKYALAIGNLPVALKKELTYSKTMLRVCYRDYGEMSELAEGARLEIACTA